MELLDAIKNDKAEVINPVSWEVFNSIGLPKLKNEAWKYTHLKNFLSEKKPHQTELKLSGDYSFKNDICIEGKTEKSKTLVQHLEQEATFFLVNSKTDRQKIIINETGAKTINLFFDGSQHFGYLNLEFEIEESVNSDLIINYFATDHTFNFCNLHFVSKKNSQCQVVFKQNANDNSTNVINHTADIARDARLSHLNFNLGSLMCRHNISFRINEEGGHADAHGLYTLKNNQHCDTHSLIDHNAPHTTSNQLYKSVLDDRSRGVFTGLIRIQSHAQKVDSAQLNKNLLISPKAHANSRPQIEVFADDVKAGHGSTTGQLSEESLFYFISRGIKEERARALLSKAFVNDVILKVRDLKIREELSELILSNMKVLN